MAATYTVHQHYSAGPRGARVRDVLTITVRAESREQAGGMAAAHLPAGAAAIGRPIVQYVYTPSA